MDMNMMISFNGGERDLDDWKSLFKMADSRLGLRYIVKPPGFALSIMELDLRGPDSIRSPI
jgi:6-hydroxytryprostatin B O-methyltransferase